MKDTFVQSFTHLKGMPRADTALEMLKKTAALIKPIMRKHGWVLPVLAEFFPDDSGLLGLNINMGQKILLRLRYAGSPDAFLPQEEVVGTMLHELTHNVYGSHNEQFYKFLDGLQEEYYALNRSGYAGEGFYSEGRRLGENVSHNVQQHVARQKALEAAEKRIRNSLLLGNGGYRLGGVGRNTELSPREMAARAAERRARDEKSCASGVLAQREAEKAAKASMQSSVINDLTQDNPDSEEDAVIITEASTSSAKNPSVLATGISSTQWSCPTCTLDNPATAARCDACDSARPIHVKAAVKHKPSSSKAPLASTVQGRLQPSQPATDPDWSCQRCTFINPHDLWVCGMCEAIKLQS